MRADNGGQEVATKRADGQEAAIGANHIQRNPANQHGTSRRLATTSPESP